MPTKNYSEKVYSTYNFFESKNISDDEIINSLLDLLKSNKIDKKLKYDFIYSNLQINDKQLNYIAIIELLGLAHQKKKEKLLISNTNERKHNGIYYTNYFVAKLIADETLSLYGDSFNPLELSFLEPCSGIGIFAIAYLNAIFETNIKYLNKAQNIINNMYFADIDGEAISLLKTIIPAYLRAVYKIETIIPKNNTFIGNILFNINKNSVSKNDPRKIFNMKNGFDIVLTNPPYKLLKANSDKYNKDADNYEEQVKYILNFIRNNNVYKHNAGTLNLYKLFVEEILENYTKTDSKIGLLIPSTLLSDKHSFELRSLMINKYRLSTIYIIPEKNSFFPDICQAFCFFALDKKNVSNNIEIKSNISSVERFSNPSTIINKSQIESISSLQEIVSTDRMGWNILSRIHQHKKLKEIPSVINLRGELDLTLDKTFITTIKTDYSLLRGNGIKEYVFVKDNLFVENYFIKKLNGKGHYLLSDRLVCQQISNMNSRKRLKFSKVPKNIVLGNSCNFIALNNDCLFPEEDISLDYLLGILNSYLLNWRFQLTSSNNHIGNYQLDELPLAIPNSTQKSIIEDLAKKLIYEPDNDEYKAELNNTVFDVYGLNKDEAMYILDKYKRNDMNSQTQLEIYQ
jgi:Alw26I/Eco31I/Esp3I family type II restriction m6 adenine DNA methyltransferase